VGSDPERKFFDRCLLGKNGLEMRETPKGEEQGSYIVNKE